MKTPKTFRELSSGIGLLLLAWSTGCSTEELTCAPGTIAKAGACVVDSNSAAFQALVQPHVSQVTLLELRLGEEGVRPVYPTHPVHIYAKVALAGDPLDAQVVAGLVSKDGKKRCVLGQTTLHNNGTPTAIAGKVAAPTELSWGEEVYAQPGCADLAGATDNQLWLAFDPFGELAVAGWPAVTVDSKTKVDDLLSKRQLKMDKCTAPASSHPG